MNIKVSSLELSERLKELSFQKKSNTVLLFLEDFLFDFPSIRKINSIEVDAEIEKIYVIEFGKQPIYKATQTELVWCYIVKNLNNFGFNSTEIKQLRKNLSVCTNGSNNNLLLLEYAIYYTVKTMHKTCLTINKNGSVQFIDLYECKTVFETDDDLNIQIHLYKYISKIDNNFNTKKYEYIIPNKNETELIALVRENDTITDVKIKLHNGKLVTADIYEKKPLSKKYIDLLNEKDYQTLTVKKENNKISFIQSNYRYFFK